MSQQSCGCRQQRHVHEILGSTGITRECNDCHNHRFVTVSGEAIPIPNCDDHYHEVTFRTDFADDHYHEFCGKSSGAVYVGNGKHVHFTSAFTNEADGHNHAFQAATLIDSPIDFNCHS